LLRELLGTNLGEECNWTFGELFGEELREALREALEEEVLGEALGDEGKRSLVCALFRISGLVVVLIFSKPEDPCGVIKGDLIGFILGIFFQRQAR